MPYDVSMREETRALVGATNLFILILVLFAVTLKWLALGTLSPRWPGLLVILVCLANAAFLWKGGETRQSAWLLIATLVFGLTSSGYFSGGLSGPVALVAPLIPVVAILLVGTRAGWICLGLVIIILSVFLVLGSTGKLPEDPNNALGLLFGRFLAVVFTGLVATWIAWRFGFNNERLAYTDHLTGIANRRAFETRLASEISRANRSDTWLTLMIADVDLFKQYNDTYGHIAGDLALVSVAKALSLAVTRPPDLVGRFGGEEFIAVLPDTNTAGGLCVANRMRHILNKQKFSGVARLSISIGIVTCRGSQIESAEALIHLADTALYRAKEAGRDQAIGLTIDHATVEPLRPLSAFASI